MECMALLIKYTAILIQYTSILERSRAHLIKFRATEYCDLSLDTDNRTLSLEVCRRNIVFGDAVRCSVVQCGAVCAHIYVFCG